MTTIIKERKAESSKRGIYIQDRELLNTVFQVGTYFRFEEDKENQTVFVLPSIEKGKNTVSKRKMKDYVKPVIDIRVKSVLACLEGCTSYMVTIYENKIQIKGIVNEEEIQEEVQEVVPEKIEVLEAPEVIEVKVIEPIHIVVEEEDQLSFEF